MHINAMTEGRSPDIEKRFTLLAAYPVERFVAPACPGA